MSLVICRKRSFFEDDLTSHHLGSKRSRRSATSPVRFSAPTTLIDRIKSIFPNMDNQLVERVLDECANDLDAAIQKLHDLSLGYGEVNPGPADAEKSNANNEKVADEEADCLLQQNIEMGGAEWIEMLVREMMSATSVDDAKSRASKVLQSLEQSISARAGVEAAQTYHKENVTLKEQIEQVLRENTILKRAVTIQHERQKEYNNKNQEVQHVKQLLSQYQEQMKTLEVNNYALTMQLQQAQMQSISMPGHLNRDVF